MNYLDRSTFQSLFKTTIVNDPSIGDGLAQFQELPPPLSNYQRLEVHHHLDIDQKCSNTIPTPCLSKRDYLWEKSQHKDNDRYTCIYFIEECDYGPTHLDQIANDRWDWMDVIKRVIRKSGVDSAELAGKPLRILTSIRMNKKKQEKEEQPLISFEQEAQSADFNVVYQGYVDDCLEVHCQNHTTIIVSRHNDQRSSNYYPKPIDKITIQIGKSSK